MIGIAQLTVFSFLVIGLIYAFLKRKEETKGNRFVKDWAPFLVLWLLYDQMRGIADNQDWINVKPVYDVEKYIFGWMFGGQIPNEWAQQDFIQNKFLSFFYAFIYTVHPIAPLLLAVLIYYKSNDREMFKEYSQSFLLTVYLALATFVFYPVAPPWYVEKHGFAQPEQLTGVGDSAAGLVDVDNYLGITAFTDFYRQFNANPYAALPSLHAAFSFFVAYYAIYYYRSRIGRKIYWIIFYPFLVWTAAVYLNHHYIVDLLAGAAYSYVSIKLVRYYRKKRGIGAKVEPRSLDGTLPNAKAEES
ncbi:MAG: hypothetical protein HeimC2_04560 [Candidatus Heimdallarchaeota archaeon LC_2]|nr:MAG: hypothetical protein HeimC2_04560 [Candidatus Heimdallarchaeota archaeon LC_2]